MAAALCQQRLPDAKQLGGFGLKASDFAGVQVLVWPENKDSVRTFIAMRNRWHVGVMGRTAINLAALDSHIWRSAGVRRRRRRQVIDDLLVMEEAALEEMNKRTDHKHG